MKLMTICALLLCALAAVSAQHGIAAVNRLKRTTVPVIPQWRCTGDFASDGQSYDVACNTNLEVISTSCTLDGDSYNCGGLQFSVDLSDDDGSRHTLVLRVRARYGNGIASLLYTFNFQRQVQQILHVNCSARGEEQDVVVTCFRVGNSMQITSIRYSVNGGTSRRASSVSSFRIGANELVEGQNTIILTVTGESGVSRDLTLNLQRTSVQSLSLRCGSQTSSSGVSITCTSNVPQSDLTLQCYLDGVLQTACGLSTDLQHSQLGQGRHNFTIVAIAGQLRVKNELSFESSVRASCFGTINLGSDTYSVTCSSNNGDLEFTECVLDGQVVPCPDLDFDISSLSPGPHSLQITGSNEFGNVATTTTDFTIPEPIGSCDIESDQYDDVIDWTCTTNQGGVSIICLVDGFPLENCLCDFDSEFFLARYPEGSHRLDLILNSDDGLSKTFSHDFEVEHLRTSSSQAVVPLEFDCISQPNNISVIVSCVSSKPVTLSCYLDGVPHSSCELKNVLYYKDLSQGLHNFTVIARDEDGLVDRSEAHFEEDLHLSCRGSYNPTSDVVHIDCDANNPLLITECEPEDGETVLCPSPYDVPISEFVDGLFSLRVDATDEFGNTDTQELEFHA